MVYHFVPTLIEKGVRLGIRDELKKNFSCGFQAQEKGVRVLLPVPGSPEKTMSYIRISISSGIAEFPMLKTILRLL